MRKTLRNELDELSLKVDKDLSNVLYELIKAIIKEAYGEPLLALIISKLIAERKIREPKELVDYMVEKPEDFYRHLLLYFRDTDSANTFLKTIFDELSRRLRVPPMGSEIAKYLNSGDYEAFRDKLLEIMYYLKTRTMRPLF